MIGVGLSEFLFKFIYYYVFFCIILYMGAIFGILEFWGVGEEGWKG